MAIIEGYLAKIYHESEGFIIGKLVSGNKSINVLGDLLGVKKGDTIRILEGVREKHKIYGDQIRITRWEKSIPTTRDGVIEFLSSGLIKGVGPKRALMIVNALGENVLELVRKEGPSVLERVPKIGKKSSEEIHASIIEYFDVQGIIQELNAIGLTSKMTMKAYKHFGPGVVDIIKSNPYRLIEINLIGFNRADAIARNLGISHNSFSRLTFGIKHCLNQAAQEGHCYLPWTELIEKAKELFGKPPVNEGLIVQSLDILKKERVIVVNKGLVYLSYLYNAEEAVISKVGDLCYSGFVPRNLNAVIDVCEKNAGIKLVDEQRSTIELLFQNNLLILTGGPGTGKTQTVKIVVDVFETLGYKDIVLCTPTGRAARVLSDITGHEAVTIHRLLNIQPGQNPEFNSQNPLRCDLIVVDEIGMVDIILAYQLLGAISCHSKVLLVGDKNQLPSIGPGNVLMDMLAAKVPNVNLTKIFRQSEGSSIAYNAHKINRGEMLDFKNSKDFYYISQNEPEKVLDLVKKSYLRLLEKGFSVIDIQVLAPMKKGATGTQNLNKILQETINPPTGQKKSVVHGSTVFRVRDKVMQIKNNYEKQVFNGEVGVIVRIDPIFDDDGNEIESIGVYVKFNGQEIVYSKDELDQLVLAYAVTVHKSQGSEYPAVILVLTTHHYIMLARNIVYTAISRAKNFFVFIGSKKALAIAVKNDTIKKRYTSLSTKLSEELMRNFSMMDKAAVPF